MLANLVHDTPMYVFVSRYDVYGYTYSLNMRYIISVNIKYPVEEWNLIRFTL